MICSEHELYYPLFSLKMFSCMNLCVFIEINNSMRADEKVVMTYVSSYYHAFSTTQKVMHDE